MATAVVMAEHKMIAKGVMAITWKWTATVTGFGSTLNAPNLPDKTVQVLGPTGGTTSIRIMGSNATTPTGSYSLLQDDQNTALSFTNASGEGEIEVVMQNPRWIRPYASTVTGGDSLPEVRMVCRSGLR